MNILFLTVARISNIGTRHIYTDLIRKFVEEGHEVYVITPLERRYKSRPETILQGGVTILQVRTLNFQKAKYIEKGFSSFLMNFQYLLAIKRKFSHVRFELVLYSTPPITFTRVVSFLKKKYGSIGYLLLKDIFPQNAIDLGIIRNGSILHRFFRRQEQKMYQKSDFIGCMSIANIEFIRRFNPRLKQSKVELNPNSIEIVEHNISSEQRRNVRSMYGIPVNAVVFIYGGNIGKPQGISFLIKILEEMKDNQTIYFVVVGSGTEFPILERWFSNNKLSNSLLMSYLPKEEYDLLVQSCDVGMIFLDKRFSIPNFPSRLLSYLEFEIPVIAATDNSTDLGSIIEEHNMGYWSIAGDLEMFKDHVFQLAKSDELRNKMGKNGLSYLMKYHDVSVSYQAIMKHFPENII